MTQRNKPLQITAQKFIEAEACWNLEQLYADLTAAKQEYATSRKQRLTPLEKTYLRGLLCNYSPLEIAAALHRKCTGIRVDLSRGLYRYIEVLTLQQPKDWKEIPSMLEIYGYKQKSSTETLHFTLINSAQTPQSAIENRTEWGLAVDTSIFYGRTTELANLRQWILQENSRLVAILGMGGIGKTALASKLRNMIKDQFECLIWIDLSHAPLLADTLVNLIECLSDRPLGDLEKLRLVSHYKKNFFQAALALREQAQLEFSLDSLIASTNAIEPTIIAEAIHRLIHCLQKHRCLIILDGWEAVFCTGQLTGNYRKGYEVYGELLKQVGELQHQSCLVLTSCEKPKEIAALESQNQSVRSLKLGSLGQAAVEIFKNKGLSEEGEYSKLIEAYSGNPLALKIVTTTINDMFGGSIANFLRNGQLLGDYSDTLSRQFHRLSALEIQLLYIMAKEVKPVGCENLYSNIQQDRDSEFLKALESLLRRSLIETVPAETETLFALQPAIEKYLMSVARLPKL
ncbi:NB-ARC domain-containing protein [Microcoleus sp. LEGE 07076]|uniref:NB-ARC domain-containing protein n=1 Tax=Microcoleus sp. LEGE 07076 TaxID=915322 RepID=UPI001D155674|nr:NB-ARC domain-containing protein [Microcoleus sp. LEGE 07076]